MSLLWLGLTVATVFLFVAASHSKDMEVCKGIRVGIASTDNNFLLDKFEIVKDINDFCGGKAEGKLIQSFDLVALEQKIAENDWVSKADIYFDRNGILHADLLERYPVAHIFSSAGNGFYLDSNLQRLPHTDKFSPRLPVFTNFPNEENGKLTQKDSALLGQVKLVSQLILKDSFLMAMIDQVDINNHHFEFIPKIGRQVIVFGDTSQAAAKMDKFKIFYRDVMVKAGGFNKYSIIDLSFSDQIVARIRGREDHSEDSLRTLHLLDMIAQNAALMASDSLMALTPDADKHKTTDLSMIQQSVEREQEPEFGEAITSAPLPVTAPVNITPAAPKVTAAPKPVAKAVAKAPVVTKAVVKKPAAAVVKSTKKAAPTAKKTTTTKAVVKKPVAKPQVTAKKPTTRATTAKNTEGLKKTTNSTPPKPKAVMPKTTSN